MTSYFKIILNLISLNINNFSKRRIILTCKSHCKKLLFLLSKRKELKQCLPENESLLNGFFCFKKASLFSTGEVETILHSLPCFVSWMTLKLCIFIWKLLCVGGCKLELSTKYFSCWIIRSLWIRLFRYRYMNLNCKLFPIRLFSFESFFRHCISH